MSDKCFEGMRLAKTIERERRKEGGREGGMVGRSNN